MRDRRRLRPGHQAIGGSKEPDVRGAGIAVEGRGDDAALARQPKLLRIVVERIRAGRRQCGQPAAQVNSGGNRDGDEEASGEATQGIVHLNRQTPRESVFVYNAIWGARARAYFLGKKEAPGRSLGTRTGETIGASDALLFVRMQAHRSFATTAEEEVFLGANHEQRN